MLARANAPVEEPMTEWDEMLKGLSESFSFPFCAREVFCARDYREPEPEPQQAPRHAAEIATQTSPRPASSSSSSFSRRRRHRRSTPQSTARPSRHFYPARSGNKTPLKALVLDFDGTITTPTYVLRAGMYYRACADNARIFASMSAQARHLLLRTQPGAYAQ